MILQAISTQEEVAERAVAPLDLPQAEAEPHQSPVTVMEVMAATADINR